VDVAPPEAVVPELGPDDADDGVDAPEDVEDAAAAPGAALPDASPLDEDAGSLLPLAPLLLLAAAGALPLFRKSVTYQPLPLSWKPAAVTCLRKVSLLHWGHTDSGGSEILRNISCAKPHDSHR
jgi:hypothetical protein